VVPPVRARAYRCGEAWSILIGHGGGTALIQGSAGFVPGALSGRCAEVVYLGVGQLGVQDEAYIRRDWAEKVEAVGARAVVRGARSRHRSGGITRAHQDCRASSAARAPRRAHHSSRGSRRG
jgi:hypothetical protein